MKQKNSALKKGDLVKIKTSNLKTTVHPHMKIELGKIGTILNSSNIKSTVITGDVSTIWSWHNQDLERLPTQIEEMIDIENTL